jgi:glutaredoxin 2
MGLIRLEFDSGKTKITAMPTIIASSRFPNKPKLLDQVRDVIRRKHYSIRTEQAYLDWIKRFIIYHNKGIRPKWQRRTLRNFSPTSPATSTWLLRLKTST